MLSPAVSARVGLKDCTVKPPIVAHCVTPATQVPRAAETVPVTAANMGILASSATTAVVRMAEYPFRMMQLPVDAFVRKEQVALPAQ